MNKTALLVIDIQNDYFPGGKFELEAPVEAAEQARKVMDAFRSRDWPIIHFRHESIRPGADFLLADTRGNQIHELVQPQDGEIVYPKHFPNAFKETPLLSYLRETGIEDLVLTGMMTFMCVHATARAASDLGFKCTVLHDATAARAIEFNGLQVPAAHVHAAFHGALAFAYAQVVSTGAYLKSIDEQA
ncbi:MAG: cysteine hydrolase family protein [Desulfobacteraceae bacterium]